MTFKKFSEKFYLKIRKKIIEHEKAEKANEKHSRDMCISYHLSATRITKFMAQLQKFIIGFLYSFNKEGENAIFNDLKEFITQMYAGTEAEE